jgi:hypothetical protein
MGRLDDQREADLLSSGQGKVEILDRILGSRKHGNVRFGRDLTGRHLVAHLLEHLRLGTDPGDAVLDTGPRELRVFREKSVPGMDEIDFLFLRQSDDILDVEVGRHGPFSAPDKIGFISLEAVDPEPVFMGEDGHGLHPELRRTAEEADGDFTAIGGKELFHVSNYRPEVMNPCKEEVY